MYEREREESKKCHGVMDLMEKPQIFSSVILSLKSSVDFTGFLLCVLLEAEAGDINSVVSDLSER